MERTPEKSFGGLLSVRNQGLALYITHPFQTHSVTLHFTLPKTQLAAEQPSQPRNTTRLSDMGEKGRGGGICWVRAPPGSHRTKGRDPGRDAGAAARPESLHPGQRWGPSPSPSLSPSLTMSRLREIQVSSSSSSRAL